MKRCIVYFTWSNTTKRLIEQINAAIPLDTYRVERLVPYSEDYDTVAYHEAKEEKEKWIIPAIKPLNVDFSQYDEILLFFPIWWYTLPLPIAAFLKELGDYGGDVVIFPNSYTNDPQYLENSLRDVKKVNPSLKAKKGLFNQDAKKHIAFIKEN